MKIRLSDIPREGSSWQLIQGQEEDLDLALRDLLGENELYSVKLRIDPLDQSGTYQVSGSISTQWDEACSRCGDDFKFKINQPFHDLLIPRLDMPRNGSTSKPQHIQHTSAQAEMSAYEYESNCFDLGEFLHEIIALARPLAPQPEVDTLGNCELCHKSRDQITAMFQSRIENSDSLKRPSPFDVLKNLKN